MRYEAHATCHDCEWGEVGPLGLLPRLTRAAEKHTKDFSHVTASGIRPEVKETADE